MVGGGQGAFIGAVHRKAMALDGQYELVAGALSSTPERRAPPAATWGWPTDRNHGDWQALLADELRAPGERIDLVTIVTPNHVHFPGGEGLRRGRLPRGLRQAAGAHSAQAAELVAAVRARGTVFGVTYNYSGYPMVRRRARWCAPARWARSARWSSNTTRAGWRRRLEAEGNKQAGWRNDPAQSGGAGALGDIGSHAENLVGTVTGLEIESLCADLSAFVPGRRWTTTPTCCCVFAGGARGVLVASQVNAGVENGCGCASRARWAPWSGGRKSRTADALPASTDRPAADARLALAASAACAPATASRRPSGRFHRSLRQRLPGRRGRDPRACGSGQKADPLDADYPAWKMVRAACASSKNRRGGI
jgi:hypothetical protein